MVGCGSSGYVCMYVCMYVMCLTIFSNTIIFDEAFK